MKIAAPGIYQMPAAAYHADPVGPAPSLSSSLARELLAASPQHAWWASARLNPAYEREEKEAFDIGNAVHAYLLEGESGCVIVDAADWRTKDAREQCDAARADGKVPLLAQRWQDVQDMARRAREQLAQHEDKPTPLTNGLPEQTLIWTEGDVWLRARLDWLHKDRQVCDDLKSTGATANPEVWSRLLFGSAYDIQAAFYLRGLKAVFGVDATFRFVVQETYAPFALSVVALGPEALALADKKVTHAIELWGECLRRGRWSGYPTRTCWAELPPWQEAQWAEREARDGWARGVEDDGRPLAEQLNRESA